MSESAGQSTKFFKPEVSNRDIISLVNFDQSLRDLLFEALSVFEVRFRSQLSFHAGAVDLLIHLSGLGLTDEFRQGATSGGLTLHEAWLRGYYVALRGQRRQDFVKWHVEKYEGKLPIWVSVEILDFGKVSELFRDLQ